MGNEITRSELTRRVHRRLVDKEFTDRLEVQLPDGSYPVLIAMRTDRVASLAHDLRSIGGRANVAVPMLNGYTVMSVDLGQDKVASSTTPRLADDCTVGVLIERLMQDGGGASYRFVMSDECGPAGGLAKMAQVAG